MSTEAGGDSVAIAENDARVAAHRAERYRSLGFHPQKEIYCNQLLPYADALDDESQRMLRSIKANLARAVACRELTPGTWFWVNRLATYIKLYGLKFSLADHVKFIKLLMSLLEMPFLEPMRLGRLCSVLSMLLRKTKRISPDELQLEWRPLYKLVLLYIDKKTNKGQFYRFYTSIEPLVIALIEKASPYFPRGTSQELMAEILPQLYPLDTGKYCDTFSILAMFLNYNDDYEQWLPHILNLWATYQNPSWSDSVMNIIADLARNNVGRIDWEPHLPMIYARILRSLSLPVYYKTIKGQRCQSLSQWSISYFISSTLGPRSSSQTHFGQLIATLESFIHPANTGKWTQTIGDVVAQIAADIVRRLVRERFRPHPWKWQAPVEHRLTDECVTRFVLSVRPFAFQALYSRINTLDISSLFYSLAELRPELIVPGVVERVYTTLDSLTEPHRLTASLRCLVSVSRALVTGHNGYTAGRTHVIPLLFAALPGIDPNDLRKSTATLEFFTSFALLVPIVDCSQAARWHDDLTDEERLICDQTAEFETFVLQYLDRVFGVIEVSAQHSVRMEHHDSTEVRSKLEAVVDASLLYSTLGIIGQCSADIVAAAVKKVIEFVRTHLFETTVAAPMAGSLVRVFAGVAAADEMQRTFLPWLLGAIHAYVDEHDDCATVEKQSDELLYYLKLLENYVRGSAEHVLNVADDVVAVFDRLRHFRCAKTTRSANNVVCYLLGTLSAMQPLDVRCSPDSFTKPLAEFLPVRHWGEKSLQPLRWWRPDERARSMCERILHRYLPGYVDEFERFAAGKVELTREVLERDTLAVHALLCCTNYLPNWEERPLELDGDDNVIGGRSVAEAEPVQIQLGCEHLVVGMPNGENVRLALIGCLSRFQAKLMRDREDNTKVLQVLAHLWDRVQLKRHSVGAYKTQLKGYVYNKMFQEHSLCARPLDLRSLVTLRVQIQHDMREQLSWPRFTATHAAIMSKLLQFSTSRYAAVRRIGQQRLFGMMLNYPQSGKCLLDEVIALLAVDANAEHDQFKGTLFVVYGTKMGRLVLMNDWPTVERLWLALLRTNLSEKPSVVRLMEAVVNAIRDEFPTVALDTAVPEQSVRLALQLNDPGDGATAPAAIDADDLAAGVRHEQMRNARNRAAYERLLHNILDITHNNSLHWRYGHMASTMINVLVHPQSTYPLAVVRYGVHNLINESIEERKMAVRMMRNALYQLKREHVKVPLAEATATVAGSRPVLRPPGPRSDNRWLQYDIRTVPTSQQQWDEPRYVHKTMGYFGWPSGYQVYAPSDRQPPVRRDRSAMTDVERVVYDFFADDAQLERLVQFWSMEEKRGEEKFHRSRMVIVKCLCDQFGPHVAERLLAHCDRLIRQKTNLESNHRAAAEIMSGIMRGVKHWPYEETRALYVDRLVPLVRLAVASVTIETDVFWGTCFATAAENMDPQRQHWLHEALLEDPLRDERSFVDCIRIYCLQGPFNQHVWRMNTVSHRLLDYLRPYLNHSFQNVRERLASLLINVFEADLMFADAAAPECPRIRDFIDETMRRLQVLYGEMPDELRAKYMKVADKSDGTDVAMEVDDSSAKAAAADVSSNGQTKEYEDAVRLFKTVCDWVTGIINRSTNGNRVEFFELLPLACRLERCDQDDELAQSCSTFLAMIAQALTLADVMPVAIETIERVSQSSSWSARVAVLDVMQVMVFNNMAIVMAQPDWVHRVQQIVLRLMEDPVLEVRSKAAQVLCGLLHCSFLPATDKLLDLFKRKCRTKISKTTTRHRADVLHEPMPSSTSASASPSLLLATTAADAAAAAAAVPLETEAPMRRRHMGVMGLCAFITAHPYEVPDFVPDVFEHLGAHLNDPQPIPSTIRLAIGNFKRTHHDNWSAHKLKFTENQLAVLSDLTIPPSYYA